MTDLYEILAKREKTGPTMRDLHEMLRDCETVGYPAWKSLYEGDWLDDTEIVTRDDWAPGPQSTVYVTQIALTGGDEVDPVMIDKARTACMIAIERHVELHGLMVTEVSWYSDRLLDEPVGVNIRAAAKCVERTDGEWPAIRRALVEDEDDRKEAASWADGLSGETYEVHSADGSLIRTTFVEDKLDALSSSAAIWSSTNPRAALAGRTTGSSVTLTRLAADGSPLPDTLPTTVTGRVRLSFDR